MTQGSEAPPADANALIDEIAKETSLDAVLVNLGVDRKIAELVLDRAGINVNQHA